MSFYTSVCVVVENTTEPQSTMELRFLSNLITEQRFVELLRVGQDTFTVTLVVVYRCIYSDRIPTNSSP